MPECIEGGAHISDMRLILPEDVEEVILFDKVGAEGAHVWGVLLAIDPEKSFRCEMLCEDERSQPWRHLVFQQTYFRRKISFLRAMPYNPPTS